MSTGTHQSNPRLQKLSIDLVVSDERWPQSVRAPAFTTAIAAAIENHVEFDATEMAVVALASNDAVQELNARYRGKNRPTNVLSFPSAPQAPGSCKSAAGETAQAHDFSPNLGDIILALETVIAEAEDKAIGIEPHTTHLIVHGILHLLGYDHQIQETAEEMEVLEIDILASLGIDNPYTEELVDQG